MITRMVALHKLDRRRIFITGLSAGGAMTAAMISAYPELFAAPGIIAGLPFGAARDVSRAIDACERAAPQRTAEEWGDLVRKATDKPLPKRLPTVSIWHGTEDRTVSLRQWRSAAAPVARRPRYCRGNGPDGKGATATSAPSGPTPRASPASRSTASRAWITARR